MEELFEVSELSKKWKVTTDQIYRWVKAGILGANKSSTGTIRITEKQAADFWARKKDSESS